MALQLVKRVLHEHSFTRSSLSFLNSDYSDLAQRNYRVGHTIYLKENVVQVYSPNRPMISLLLHTLFNTLPSISLSSLNCFPSFYLSPSALLAFPFRTRIILFHVCLHYDDN